MRAIRIGRIFGIDLRVDWSWVFIFVLMTWNLFSLFAGWHSTWTPFEDGALAFASALIFFGCIVLHELAHSVVATGYGLRVRSITLFLFGGVSNIESEPSSAKVEFFTAIAGPITSVVLGILFLAVASAISPAPLSDAQSAWSVASRLGPAATLLAWLGGINITIGLFNLIPGFPLDGGRVLRSILWSVTGDLRAATRWSAATGQGIGWVFIAGGLAMTFGAHLPIFGTGFVSGLWLAFIGWFLHGAAAQAATRLALDDALAGMTVADLMQKDPPTVDPDLSVAALVHDHLVPGEERALPVVRNGTLLGLISFSDIRAFHSTQWADTRVAALMRGVETLSVVTPQESLARAFEQLVRRDFGQLPVVVRGKLVGVLRRRDVTRWLELAWKPAAGPRNAATPGSSPAPRRPRDDDRGHPIAT